MRIMRGVNAVTSIRYSYNIGGPLGLWFFDLLIVL